MELARQTRTAISLATEAEILSFDYQSDRPIEVVARITLGDSDHPLSGDGGTYFVNFYLNGTVVAPVSDLTVDPGKTTAIMVSRIIPIGAYDVLTIGVRGATNDLVVNTLAILRDVTPTKLTEITGEGLILVNHDYGSPDALTVMTREGKRVEDVIIRCYLRDDYRAGRTNQAFILAEILTDAEGHWRHPMMLDPGYYVLVVFKSGVIKTTVRALTVNR